MQNAHLDDRSSNYNRDVSLGSSKKIWMMIIQMILFKQEILMLYKWEIIILK
jgi:hypothetical protein